MQVAMPAETPHWLAAWSQTDGGVAELVNLSENHTFRIIAPGGTCFLRVHRPGYQSAASIGSELAWLADLRLAANLPVPEALAGRDGQLIQHIVVPGETTARAAVLFAALPGREPTLADDLPRLFHTLGALTARMHLRTTSTALPTGFSRPRWDAPAILDADGPWGDWRMAPGVDATIRAVLETMDAHLRRQLAAYGTTPDRFGLIHADMRLANLLVDGENLTIIDFDDCGFCWFGYDFAAAVSFFEDHPIVSTLKASWLTGYTAHRPQSPADIAMLDTMVMLRRMALLAWIGSHAETPLAQQYAADFAAGSAALAQRYLASSAAQ